MHIYFLCSLQEIKKKKMMLYFALIVRSVCFSCCALAVPFPSGTQAPNLHSLVGKTAALRLGCEESAKRLLGDGSWAIPRTGGWGERGW